MGAIFKIISLVKSIVAGIKALMVELAVNGKTLVGYLLLEFPELSNYPGLVDAIESVASDPSNANIMRLVAHVIMALGAGHRSIKILKGALERLR